jgi:NAD(P)-dependent dehydrogenase (short-subunit alcohol dehydrogenase family)
VRCDVTVEADCEASVVEAAARLGGLDGMFHCAGVSDVVSKVHDLDIDVWQRIVDINLRGTFLMARAASRPLLAQGAGSIVTVSSVNGMNGIPRRNAYGPAKAAIAMLTRNLACEWGGTGIRVNALSPGYIRTPMVAALIKADRIDVPRIEQRTPMERMGEVDEVGSAAAFLLSDLASYITGAVLPVDGGWTAYGGAGEVRSA